MEPDQATNVALDYLVIAHVIPSWHDLAPLADGGVVQPQKTTHPNRLMGSPRIVIYTYVSNKIHRQKLDFGISWKLVFGRAIGSHSPSTHLETSFWKTIEMPNTHRGRGGRR